MIDLWESLFRTATALAIVLVLIGVVTVVFRRVMGTRWGAVGGRQLVQVLATGHVAPRKTISLVSVAGEYLIVGATATELVPLGRINDSSRVTELLAQTADTSSTPTLGIRDSIFSSWLRRRDLVVASSEKDGHGP
ncbi:MAG: flagellar biosynthetic protein FliO [Nitrospira sp.]|nr:flagellar biosynthetic protein FliO [Nitrospira sp.]